MVFEASYSGFVGDACTQEQLELVSEKIMALTQAENAKQAATCLISLCADAIIEKYKSELGMCCFRG